MFLTDVMTYKILYYINIGTESGKLRDRYSYSYNVPAIDYSQIVLSTHNNNIIIYDSLYKHYMNPNKKLITLVFQTIQKFLWRAS